MAKSEEERALVQMSSLLSMSRSELNFELETAKSHTDELKNACDRLNELINALKTSVDAEEVLALRIMILVACVVALI